MAFQYPLVIYKIVYDVGGDEEAEGEDGLERLKQHQAISPGVITAYERHFTIANDPEGPDTDYPSVEAWEARVLELQQQFYPTEVRQILDPQPEGLNP